MRGELRVRKIECASVILTYTSIIIVVGTVIRDYCSRNWTNALTAVITLRTFCVCVCVFSGS